jgi:hypothetical protein
LHGLSRCFLLLDLIDLSEIVSSGMSNAKSLALMVTCATLGPAVAGAAADADAGLEADGAQAVTPKARLAAVVRNFRRFI